MWVHKHCLPYSCLCQDSFTNLLVPTLPPIIMIILVVPNHFCAHIFIYFQKHFCTLIFARMPFVPNHCLTNPYLCLYGVYVLYLCVSNPDVCSCACMYVCGSLPKPYASWCSPPPSISVSLKANQHILRTSQPPVYIRSDMWTSSPHRVLIPQPP